MDDTIGHLLDLDLQITKGRTHTLRSGETSLDAIAMYAGCFEEVLQFLDGVEDEPCIGDGSQPIFVLFLFLFHTFWSLFDAKIIFLTQIRKKNHFLL